MRDPVLWLPPAQTLEGVDLSTRSESARTVVEALLAGARSGDSFLLPRSLASGALPIMAKWRAWPPAAAVLEGPERHIEYDAYFGVRRLADTAPLNALGEAVVVAYHRWLTNCAQGHSLSPVELGYFHDAFDAMLALVAGASVSAAVSAPPSASSGPPPEGAIDALLRWKIGHHTFFVLTQTLILVHTQLAGALEQADLSAAREALSLATRLWWGTAAAFRYTGDFPAEDYESIVRPSMSPPFLKDGFSGFFSSDHVYLIRALKRLQPSLKTLPTELGPAHRSYLQSLDAAYETHAFVCEAFVGAGHSLRSNQLDRSAVGPTFIRSNLKSRAMTAAGHPPKE